MKTLYVVQTVLPWSSMSVDGIELPKNIPNGPTGFLPVFDDYEKAKEFANGDEIKAVVTQERQQK